MRFAVLAGVGNGRSGRIAGQVANYLRDRGVEYVFIFCNGEREEKVLAKVINKFKNFKVYIVTNVEYKKLNKLLQKEWLDCCSEKSGVRPMQEKLCIGLLGSNGEIVKDIVAVLLNGNELARGNLRDGDIALLRSNLKYVTKDKDTGTLIIDPGSLSGKVPSFAIINIDENRNTDALGRLQRNENVTVKLVARSSIAMAFSWLFLPRGGKLMNLKSRVWFLVSSRPSNNRLLLMLRGRFVRFLKAKGKL
ncbi:MAG: hypothetical protein ACOX3T_08235 [Bdellovibrionota bacterium]